MQSTGPLTGYTAKKVGAEAARATAPESDRGAVSES